METVRVKQLVLLLKEQTTNWYGDSILPFEAYRILQELIQEVEKQ